jgi:hypothetical protein
MIMTRRKLLSLLAGLPLVGRFAPKPQTTIAEVVKTCNDNALQAIHMSPIELVEARRNPLFAWYEQECAGYLQDMKDRLAIMAAPRPRKKRNR